MALLSCWSTTCRRHARATGGLPSASAGPQPRHSSTHPLERALWLPPWGCFPSRRRPSTAVAGQCVTLAGETTRPLPSARRTALPQHTHANATTTHAQYTLSSPSEPGIDPIGADRTSGVLGLATNGPRAKMGSSVQCSARVHELFGSTKFHVASNHTSPQTRDFYHYNYITLRTSQGKVY